MVSFAVEPTSEFAAVTVPLHPVVALHSVTAPTSATPPSSKSGSVKKKFLFRKFTACVPNEPLPQCPCAGLVR